MYLKYFEGVTGNTIGYENQKAFNVGVECSFSLFLNKLNNFQTGQINKIRFELHNAILNKQDAITIPLKDFSDKEREQIIENKTHLYHNYIDDLIDVVQIHRRFDFDNWFKQNKKGKKRLIIDEIYAGMLLLSEYFAWKKEQIHSAYNACKAVDFENSWLVKKLKIKNSPNKKFKAAVYVEYDIDEFRIFAIVYDKTGNEIKKQLIQIVNFFDTNIFLPEDLISLITGKTKWIKNEFILCDKSGKEIGRTNVEKAAVLYQMRENELTPVKEPKVELKRNNEQGEKSSWKFKKQ